MATLSFIVSMYLDWIRPDLLAPHPITVNLVSGIVGFSAATLVIALGFNWFIRRDARIESEGEVAKLEVCAKKVRNAPNIQMTFVEIRSYLVQADSLIEDEVAAVQHMALPPSVAALPLGQAENARQFLTTLRLAGNEPAFQSASTDFEAHVQNLREAHRGTAGDWRLFKGWTRNLDNPTPASRDATQHLKVLAEQAHHAVIEFSSTVSRL
jgi:hypothetical protein